MITFHQKNLSQPERVKDSYPQSYPQNFRTLKPAQFLNNLDQLHEFDSNLQIQQQNAKIFQQGAQTDRVQEEIHFPKIKQNSSQVIQKPLNLMPESKHNQLKAQLQNIFQQQNTQSENHIVLPGFQKQRKESHMFLKMIEEQISFPIHETQKNRFSRKKINQVQSQTNLESIMQAETEASQNEDQLNNQRKVDFYQKVKVINLQNGRIATEVIKEEDEQKPPVKTKRKFVSQKTKFFPEN